jgi:excisionase family DNA binding protein
VSRVSDEFLTVAEVAALLKLNQQTIRNSIEAGTLPAYRLGRRVRIGRDDFERLIEAGSRSDVPLPAPSIWDGEIPLPVAPGS